MAGLVIGIAGGTGSGKTTVARAIATALPADRVASIEYDSYYRDRPDRYPNSFFVWQWLSVERWWRLFIDGGGAPARPRAPAIGNTRRYPPAHPARGAP